MTGRRRSVLVFRVGERRFAVEAEAVESVERMVEVTPLPGGPEGIAGVVQVGGEVAPVFALRRRIGLPDRASGLNDFLIIARSETRRVALVAEEIEDVREIGEIWSADEAVNELPSFSGIIQAEDGLIFVHDLNRFLRAAEEDQLREALRDMHDE